jgi:RNA-directed DNA polymerase
MNDKIVKINIKTDLINDWSDIDWKSVNKSVIKLRRRIFDAKRDNLNSLRSLQKLMLISSANILYSIRKISYNSGSTTPGIDGIILKNPSDRLRLFYEILSNKWSGSSPKPIRRIYIKEVDKLRPIGIPIVYDRVIQVMICNSLEPEWEAIFEKGSYGFRPKRNVNDAVSRLWLALNKPSSRKWIVDSDITKCFDSISHKYLLEQIEGFPGKSLIKEMLEAGIIINNLWMSSDDEGTPQGSALSPLLCNIALHGLESELGVLYNKKGYVDSKGRLLIRYADDLVILCHSKPDAMLALDSLKLALFKRNLIISELKTKIVHISEGFDFLGFNIKMCPKRHISRNKSIILMNDDDYKIIYKNVGIYVTPSKKSLKKIKSKIKNVLIKSKGSSADKFINKLNPIIRGYALSKLHWHSNDSFRHLDHYLYTISWRWASRKHPQKGKKWIYSKYFTHLKYGPINSKWTFFAKKPIKDDSEYRHIFLFKFRWFPIRDYLVGKMDKLPDNRFDSEYFSDLEFRRLISKPFNIFKKMDLYLSISQNGLCPICDDLLFNGEKLHIHHIVPHSEGGKYSFSNLVYLHLVCHYKIHFSSNYDDYMHSLLEYKKNHPMPKIKDNYQLSLR